jgi:cytochrome c oxidase subunit IV
VSEVSHTSHKKEYMIIFGILALLTVVELIIPGMDISYFAKASSLCGLALGKAAIVAYYYMHLKEETKWMKFIALIPMSAFIYALVVILESLYR